MLTDDLGLIVTPVDHLANKRADGGACDGISFLQDGVMLYAPTPWSRRENFTLAHELGHWLVDETPEIYDWLADQENAGQLLETVCDRIAQSLLLPAPEIATIVRGGPVRARHVGELYDATQASMPVCAIALNRHVPGVSAIAIIDRYTRSVTFASVKPDPNDGWPTVMPWRGQCVDGNHPLLTLAPGKSTTRRLSWHNQWGGKAEYYVDAIGSEKRIVATFCTTDIWEIDRFHAPIDRDFDARPVASGSCCGQAFERRGYPCPECDQPFCPRCERCRCQRLAESMVTCSQCFVMYPSHLIAQGVCEDCRP
ncbi:ImmA/IrrE family metallo-endopeptidase [Dietzia maris]|uniref:ImmA/IrrE family metallo-endopeptidase n=1 Tax=Dietzia maris TaxID=37915 RepID=UPI0037C5DBB8